MVIKCTVRGCDSKLIKGNGIQFYRLPLEDSVLLKKWLKALKIYNWEPTKYFKLLRVCAKHFREDCFQKSSSEFSSSELSCFAVPSIFPDIPQPRLSIINQGFRIKYEKHVNEIMKKLEKQSNKVSSTRVKENGRVNCFVPNCKSPKNTPCYKLPLNDKRLFNLWIKRMGLSLLYDINIYLNIIICKNHFHESCFIGNSLRLKSNAIPSVNLIDYNGPPENCCLMNSTYSDENSMNMSSTGDGTWGWLGSTEQFGRPSEPNEFVIIPKEQINDEKYASSTQAVHCMIYAENNERVFDIYHPRAAILLQMRFDGYFGFPGGLIDPKEDVVSAVNREMVEEMNLNTDLYSVTPDDHIVSHWSEKKNLTLHFYKLKISMDELIEIEKRALLARDYGSEVLGTVRIPLYTLGDNVRGFPVFLKHKFIGCAQQQLLTALTTLNIMTHEEIILALNANNV